MEHIPTSMPSGVAPREETGADTVLRTGDGRIWLEAVGERHVAALYQASAESAEALRQWLGETQTFTSLDDARSYVTLRVQRQREGSEYWFVLCDAEGVAGVAFLNTIHPTHRFANLGYWVHTGRTGRGYASTATRLLARFGFERLGLQRIEIVAEVANAASQRAAEKAGAVREGVLRHRLLSRGEPRDGVMFSLIPEDLGL